MREEVHSRDALASNIPLGNRIYIKVILMVGVSYYVYEYLSSLELRFDAM